MAYIALLVTTLLVSCYPGSEPSADTKFSSFDQSRNPFLSWFFNRKILIKMVHEKKWRIGIKYDKDTNFTPDQKKELETAIEKALNTWLEPVREYSKGYGGRNVVEKFEFIEINPRPFKRYHKREPRQPIDLEITFKEGWGRSHWRPKVFSGVGMVRMFKGNIKNGWITYSGESGDNKIPQNSSIYYSWNTLLHEIGHAFGLCDTYPEGRRKSTGGSDETSGEHAESAMSALGHELKDRQMELTRDDIVGIQHIYRFNVLGYEDEENCVCAEFKWDKPSKGCIPKHPVIFATKYGDKPILERLLNGDPNVNVNETDPLGNTALHHAVANGKSEKAEKLINELLNHPNIDPEIPNNEDNTAYDLAIDYNEKVASLGKEEQAAVNPIFDDDILRRLNPNHK